ncbi:MAG TPA: NAD-dependent succinate-semialdehyde dehydrogenase, partial [Candidatus Dormibacteraeota bacterium]|nr:NAD-dependent succinate-semialdehyde dehydrogenase [Candidatus Dormibacteraeota bacterium]
MTGTALDARERAAIDAVPAQLLVDGVWRDATGGGVLAVEDPSTGDELCVVADATPEDGLAALDAAARAQVRWAAHPPRERGEVLRRAHDALVRRADELALVMTLEMGKPIAESRAEVLYSADFLRWFSEEAVRIDGRYTVGPGGGDRLLVLRQPVGPCVLVTPWNFPMAMGARKIAPAVAAGCAMVVKPAHQTPLSMLALARTLEEAGLPPGVLNVVPTTDADRLVSPLLRDPRTRKLSFTGSTAVGARLASAAASRMLRVSMELGGNAPFVVFEDADLEAAVDGAVVAKMRNTGEACTAANRFLVAERVAEDFVARLAARLAAMRVGRGTDPGSQVGPLIDEAARHRVARLVGDAVARGARTVAGGAAIEGPGHFYAPTVLAGVPPESRVLHEEVFGPVAPVTTFATDAEAIAAANSTDAGLVAYVFTRDIDRALRVVEALEVGMVGLNQGMVSNAAAPFGGVK